MACMTCMWMLRSIGSPIEIATATRMLLLDYQPASATCLVSSRGKVYIGWRSAKDTARGGVDVYHRCMVLREA